MPAPYKAEPLIDFFSDFSSRRIAGEVFSPPQQSQKLQSADDNRKATTVPHFFPQNSPKNLFFNQLRENFRNDRVNFRLFPARCREGRRPRGRPPLTLRA
ncbi:MAG: hypothetical protein JSS81_08860 [Acidobacteria bacterium]|nr:hypothetical protein [Acidobacteriota bacterium]